MIGVVLGNIILGFVAGVPFGPGNVELVRQGTTKGTSHAIMALLGIMLADLVYISLVSLGGAVALSNPTVLLTLTAVGVSVLTFFGLTEIRVYFRKDTPKEKKLSSLSKNPFLRGFVIVITSPYTILFWAGVAGPLAILSGGVIDAFITCIAIEIGCILAGCVYIMLSHAGKRFMTESRKRTISLISGLCLLGFAVYLFIRGLSFL